MTALRGLPGHRPDKKPTGQTENVTVHAQVGSTGFSRKIDALHAKSEICASRNHLLFPSTIPPKGGIRTDRIVNGYQKTDRVVRSVSVIQVSLRCCSCHSNGKGIDGLARTSATRCTEQTKHCRHHQRQCSRLWNSRCGGCRSKTKIVEQHTQVRTIDAGIPIEIPRTIVGS